MASLAEQLDLMLTLKTNWDGYGADPILPEAVNLGKEFVAYFQHLERRLGVDRQLSVHPSRVGGIQIEWADAKADYELEINPDGSLGVLRTDRFSGHATEKAFTPPTEPRVITSGLLPWLAGLELGLLQEAA